MDHVDMRHGFSSAAAHRYKGYSVQQERQEDRRWVGSMARSRSLSVRAAGSAGRAPRVCADVKQEAAEATAARIRAASGRATALGLDVRE
jgi:hypothetical protein